MDPFFQDYYDRLSTLHNDLAATVEGLTAEGLDWRPGPDTNSLVVLLTHTAGSERYWIGEIVGQEPAGRIRAQEFETLGKTAEQLQERLDLALAHSRQTLSALSLDNLVEARLIPEQGRSCTVAWALLHALEHTAQHVGHAQLTRQMWEELR
ncbi:MAG: DinB family protein [Candidatus Promineifilaceae bacterium]|jgi:uncharacterized damage-inducible protein DinB